MGKKRCSCIIDKEGNICRKVLKLTDMECKCGKRFCSVHRLPENHFCSFNFKEEGRKILEKKNPVVAAPKIIPV